MSGYLLDTNVLSEVLKKRPEPRLLERLKAVPQRRLATSAVCVAELRYGAARHERGGRLWERIAAELLTRVRILPFGVAEAVRAGDIFALLEAQGTSIGSEDVWIAATAMEEGLTLVTRNLRHFDRVPGLAVESWWS